MNIGQKISLYKERLGFKNFTEFSKAAGLNNDWLLEISKKSEIKMVDIGNLIKISEYLQLPLDQLVKDDKETLIEQINVEMLDKLDISSIIKEIIFILDIEDAKMDGKIMNNQSKQICKDGLEVLKQLIQQYM